MTPFVALSNLGFHLSLEKVPFQAHISPESETHFMAWKKEIGPDGLPAWRGENDIRNVFQRLDDDNRKQQAGLAIGCLYPLAAVAGAMIGGLLGAILTLSSKGAPIGALVGACAVILAIREGRRRDLELPLWLGGSWALIHRDNFLAYAGAEQWAVDLDQIARVETSPTHDWQKVRKYPRPWGPPKIAAIPEVEMQTFLILNDTSRRVIYTANADREGCATLAHSIREYLETVRSVAPVAASAPAAPAAGFDL